MKFSWTALLLPFLIESCATMAYRKKWKNGKGRRVQHFIAFLLPFLSGCAVELVERIVEVLFEHLQFVQCQLPQDVRRVREEQTSAV